MVDIAAVTGNEIRQAVSLDWGDFASAVLPVVSPDEFLALLIPPDKSE